MSLAALEQPSWGILSRPRGGLNSVAAKICYSLSFREFEMVEYYHSFLWSGIESADLKVKVLASFWTYLKVLDLVFKLEEYLDPRSIV